MPFQVSKPCAWPEERCEAEATGVTARESAREMESGRANEDIARRDKATRESDEIQLCLKG